MSDSGKLVNECPHGRFPDRCVTCLNERVKELEASFDLRWKADMRAIKRWQKENPKERKLIWPDHVELIIWLLSELKKTERKK